MSKVTRCDGCGKSVPLGDEHDIRPTRLSVEGSDRREWAQTDEDWTADLCATCRGQLLATFFGIPAEGGLELPAFITPPPTALETEGTR